MMTVKLLLMAISPRIYFAASLLLSPPGRALLVAALLISVYALVRYWRSLNQRSNQVRLSLVGLRALTFVLMSCALAGLQVEYEKTMRARVLLSSTRMTEENGKQETGAEVRTNQIAEQAIAALKRKGFEVVEPDLSGIDAPGSFDETNKGSVFAADLLVTDGAMSASDARREVKRANARAGGAPVYVIADSERGEGTSVVLENMTALGCAVRGVPVAVRCMVHARGMQGRESLLTIADEAKVQASARIAWTSADERQSVTLTVVPKVAGWIDYKAKVEAAGSEDAAQLARPFSLSVEERRWRVLFFESEPTWEAKFIRRALEQSTLFDVDYFAQVSRTAIAGASEGAKEQDGAEKSEGNDAGKSVNANGSPEARLHVALQSAARLNAYDCVIVGATENGLLSSAEAARLREWVERRGGGLIILGGNSFNNSIAAPGGKLYSLLPAEISTRGFSSQAEEISRGRPLEAEKTRAQIFLTPTTEGATALAGYLNANEETNAKAVLTGQGFRLGALRPGAGVLAVAGQPEANGTSEQGAAEIAAARYGAGRTLVFAPADSWRLRTTSANVDEENAGGAFNALWQGLVLWTSAGAREPVEIVLSEESPAEESTLTAEIRVRDASYASLKIEKLNARLLKLTDDAGEVSQDNSQAQEIAFVPDKSESSVWRAQFPLHRRGRFALQVDYAAGGQTGSIEKQFAIVAATHEEAGASFDTLRRVARDTGGDLITSNEVDALAERLAATSLSNETTRHIWELRGWWPLAFIIPLLLSAEWFARRWWKEE
jgi:hypothetical protein